MAVIDARLTVLSPDDLAARFKGKNTHPYKLNGTLYANHLTLSFFLRRKDQCKLRQLWLHPLRLDNYGEDSLRPSG